MRRHSRRGVAAGVLLACLATLACVAAPAAVPAGYLRADAIRIEELLPAPPAPGSDADRRDLDAVRAAQAARTPATIAAAEADAKVTVFRFADVLGPGFAPERAPKTEALFRAVAVDGARIAARAKDFWQRPRPYRADPAITPLVGVSTDGAYPSGHAMFGCTAAVLLGVMVPEQRAALLARGDAFGANRITGGVHYPTDVAAGCTAGKVVAAVLLVAPAFQADFAAARDETRQALGLPALPR
jgi:acid phosphatase (class A)